MSVITTQLAAGNFKIMRDSQVVFETNALRKSFNLVPSAQISLTSYAFSFPNFLQDNWYRFSGKGHDPTPGNGHYYSDCDSYVAIRAQEWGPGLGNNISDLDLGSLPVGTDYLDVQVQLTRTSAPTPFFGQTWPAVLPSGQWCSLDGGATIMEGITNTIQRMISFHIDNSNPADPHCKLRRRQTVFDSDNTFINPSSGTQDQLPGYTYLATRHGLFAYYLGHNASDWIDFGQGAPPANYWCYRGAQFTCPQTSSVDFSSTWSGNIKVTPGRVSAAP